MFDFANVSNMSFEQKQRLVEAGILHITPEDKVFLSLEATSGVAQRFVMQQPMVLAARVMEMLKEPVAEVTPEVTPEVAALAMQMLVQLGSIYTEALVKGIPISACYTNYMTQLINSGAARLPEYSDVAAVLHQAHQTTKAAAEARAATTKAKEGV